MTAITRGRLLRRAALAFGGAAGVGGAITALAGATAEKTDTYVLLSDGCTHGPSCRACTACTRHAAHSLFASADAADRNRAHPGCTCTVAAGPRLPADAWRALFGDPSSPTRGRVDRRATWVAETLAAAAVPAAAAIVTLPVSSPAPTVGDDVSEAPASWTGRRQAAASPPSRPAEARADRLRCRVEVTRNAAAGRPLDLHVLVDRSCTLDVRLLARDGRRVAGGYWHVAAGASTHRLRLRPGVAPGSYRLRVRASAGEAVTLVECRVTV
jgi:hypothetical protein